MEELRIAVEFRTPVIPVLVDDARMPRRQDLPEVLAPLTHIQAAQLRHASFASDADRLIAMIKDTQRRMISGPDKGDRCR